MTEFVYDGDGNRVRKTVSGGDDILYINRYYEKNLTGGNITVSYYLGDRLVAQRFSCCILRRRIFEIFGPASTSGF